MAKLTVLEIAPEARYAICLDEHLPHQQIERIAKALSEWWERGDKFIILDSGLTLVRVTEEKPDADKA